LIRLSLIRQSRNAPGDFFFNGSKSAWIAAVHTIKARLFLHIHDYANALTQAAQGISNVSGNLMATHGNAVQQISISIIFS